MIVNTYAANRDHTVYDNPTRFDIARRDSPPILTFGGGAHYCLGANLARLELAEALKILSRRIPEPRCVGREFESARRSTVEFTKLLRRRRR